MVSSLKDALLGAGLKAPEPKSKPVGSAKRPSADFKGRKKPPRSGHTQQHKVPLAALKDDSDVSLAAAYKARLSQEQRERDLAKRKKEAEAKAKRERAAKVAELLAGKVLNDENAEESRYFEYARKIRRIYVTQPQQDALNAGELGVVQSKGTYYLVPAEVAKAVRDQVPDFLALLVDPDDKSLDEGDIEKAATT